MVSVVTVNFKTIDYTLKMLESFFAYHNKGGIEVFVVENGSGDDTSELEKRFPQVKLIASEKNLGFAGGCNLAIKQSVGDLVLLVNPDILFIDDAIYKLEEKMLGQNDIGVSGVSLKNLDGSQQDCVWGFPKPLDQFFVLLKLHHLFPKLSSIQHWQRSDFDYSISQDVDQVMGAFFCIRRELLNEIGTLDDGFFVWYEEVDFCKRAKNANWRVHYFADISVLHKKGGSFDRVATIQKQRMLRHSVRRYMFKHEGKIAGTFFLIFEPLFWIASFVTALIKPV